MVFLAVVKEREMEIGYPTDVKHVAHIGLDGPSGSAPSWVCTAVYKSSSSINCVLVLALDIHMLNHAFFF